MAIDGGVIVGYLTAALVRAGKHLADRAVDELLTRLSDAVIGRMGARPIERLSEDPGSVEAQRAGVRPGHRCRP